MSENQATTRYNYRIRPGVEAERRLIMEWNCARWVWNQCVEAGEASYKAFKEDIEHESPTFCRMSKKLTSWRAEHEWLREGSQVVQQQTIRKWAIAYQRALKLPATSFPKFKSVKLSLPSLAYTFTRFKIKDEKLYLAGGISIPVVWSRELPHTPTSCAVYRDGAGHWTVSFVIRRDSEVFPDSEASIGIDWGVKTVATTTDPEFDLQCGGQTEKHAQELRTANRKLARSKDGSRGRRKAKEAVARIHLRIARQRKDRAFKWARKVVTAFGHIAIEDFKPTFLAKTRMAKKATDGSVGLTKRILITMAKAAERCVVLVNPAYTTMDCEKCGARAKHRLPLSQRTFCCWNCGHTIDRDRNASGVIRSRAGFNPTDVDDIRPKHRVTCSEAV